MNDHLIMFGIAALFAGATFSAFTGSMWGLLGPCVFLICAAVAEEP